MAAFHKPLLNSPTMQTAGLALIVLTGSWKEKCHLIKMLH
jgi:hypothetical protein